MNDDTVIRHPSQGIPRRLKHRSLIVSREVVKHVGQRAYRYAVERVEDAATGKSKRRWRYLGPVGAGPGREDSANVAPSTRDRLLEAFEGLLADRSFASLTISAIGQAAGLAHGTFYRYFRDKEAVLEAAVERIKADLDRVEPQLDLAIGSLERERERVERWLDALTAIPAKRTALVRAWYLHRTATGDLAKVRRERREVHVERFSAYLAALEAAGLATVADGRSLAIGVLVAIDGVMRRAIVEDEVIDEETIAALRTIVTRAVFGG